MKDEFGRWVTIIDDGGKLFAQVHASEEEGSSFRAQRIIDALKQHAQLTAENQALRAENKKLHDILTDAETERDMQSAYAASLKQDLVALKAELSRLQSCGEGDGKIAKVQKQYQDAKAKEALGLAARQLAAFDEVLNLNPDISIAEIRANLSELRRAIIGKEKE